MRYIHECRPDVEHASLTDAMACLGIEWDGVAHTSIADTIGCMKVWGKLFPNYYIETGEADPEPEDERSAAFDYAPEAEEEEENDSAASDYTADEERSTLFDLDLYALAADDGSSDADAGTAEEQH